MHKIRIWILILGCLGASRLCQAQGAAADSILIKYISVQIQDPEIFTGIFRKPSIGEPSRQLKSGLRLESQEEYIALRRQGILKLNTISGAESEFDSVVFIDNPPQEIKEDGSATFFSFPGTTWLLFLKKGIMQNNDKKETRDWLKDVKSLINIKFLTPATAYYLASQYNGNYVLQWNETYPTPSTVVIMQRPFADDIITLANLLKTLPAGTAFEQKSAKIKSISGKIKTPEGKRLITELLSK